DLLELAKGLSPVLGIVHVSDLAAIDLQMAFPPRGDVDFERVAADHGDELLNGSAFPDGMALVRLPVWHGCGHPFALVVNRHLRLACPGAGAVASSWRHFRSDAVRQFDLDQESAVP